MVRIPIPITNDPVEFDGFCPFPIEYQDLRGAVFQVLTFDADGNLTRIEIFSPGLTSEVSANGKSVVFNDARPDHGDPAGRWIRPRDAAWEQLRVRPRAAVGSADRAGWLSSRRSSIR